MNLHHLSQMSFVRPTAGGFALHDVARAYLVEDFVQREPVRYQSLRLRIVEEWVRERRKAGVHEKKQISAHLLAICRDAFRLGSIAIFSADPLSCLTDSFRQGDLPHLHRLLTEQGQTALSLESFSKIHEFMDARNIFRYKQSKTAHQKKKGLT